MSTDSQALGRRHWAALSLVVRLSSRQGETHAQFAFEVAFGEGQVGDGEPLMPNLKLLINFTERVVDIFHRHIFRHA